MYAIIRTGGKQVKVAKGDVIDVELLGSEAGQSVEFKDVLFVADGSTFHVGKPQTNYVVVGEIMGESYGEKIRSAKYKPRKREERYWGHRQKYNRVKITEITAA